MSIRFLGNLCTLLRLENSAWMAHFVNTHEGGEANESTSEPSSSDKPTLQELISRELGQSANTIYTKLTTEIGITKIDSLIFMDLSDLNELCTALNLSFGEKLKFKAAIIKLQQLFKPQQPQSIVTISSKEEKMIQKIDVAIKQSNDIQNILEQHFNTIDDNTSTVKTQIHTEIDNAIKSLQNREKLLYQQVFL